MWHYPEMDPVALSLGPLKIHWYALSYLIGIGLAWWALIFRSERYQLSWNREQISDLIFYIVLGVILGGRIGYMLFYGWEDLLDDPVRILKVWQGGMSFHGGFLGVLLAVFLYAKKSKRQFFAVTDVIAPLIPFGLGTGRLGNFINGELPGRVTDVPWAAIYPGEVVGRHPSSLYQSLLEGPVLLLIMWFFARKPRPVMAVSGVFLMGYGCLRIVSEFFREPDAHLGFIALNFLTMGQLLSLPMVLFGIGFLIWAYGSRQRQADFKN